MDYVLGALAVYKIVQLLDALAPKEAMPWVKVLVGIVCGYIVSFVINTPDKWVSGLVIATLAGTCHGVLRFITLIGDSAGKRTPR
jgi:uncharacterized membrane protein YkgB